MSQDVGGSVSVDESGCGWWVVVARERGQPQGKDKRAGQPCTAHGVESERASEREKEGGEGGGELGGGEPNWKVGTSMQDQKKKKRGGETRRDGRAAVRRSTLEDGMDAAPV